MKTDNIFLATIEIKKGDMRDYVLSSMCAYFKSNKIDTFIALNVDKEAKSLRDSTQMDVSSIWQLADQLQLEYFEINKNMTLIVEESRSNDFEYLLNMFFGFGAKVILLKNI